jgi:2-polyprenyl-3-methyl-5-hydroxy-6-metoxy-1,4-benzoquinol methylase
MLVSFFDRIVAVDGSEHAIMSAREYVNSDKVEFIHSYFEEFTSDERFDTVILAHILEHVDNPIEILKI